MINMLLSNTISFSIITYVGKQLLTPREFRKGVTITIFILTITGFTVLNGNHVSEVNTITLTIGYFLYMLLLFQSPVRKIFLVFLTCIICIALGELITANLLNLMMGMISNNETSSYQYTLAVILSGIYTFVLELIYIRLMKFSYWKELLKYSYAIIVLPIATMLLIVNIDDYFSILKDKPMLGIVIGGLLAANFITLFTFLKTAESIHIKGELENVKLEKKLSDVRYGILDNQFKSNYTFMHDTIRSIMKIERLLQSKEYDTFQKELLALNNKMLKELNIVNSNSSMISPIINFRLKDMMDYDIDFKSVLEYTEFEFIDTYEQRFVFDTLVDIGIKACASSDRHDKLMILKTKKLQKQVIIQLLFSHSSLGNQKDFLDSYHQLEELVNKHNGLASFEPSMEIDSLILLFKT